MRRSRTRWGTATVEKRPGWASALSGQAVEDPVGYCGRRKGPCVASVLCDPDPAWLQPPRCWVDVLTKRPVLCRTAGAVREEAALCEEEEQKRAARGARFAAAPVDEAANERAAATRRAWPGGTTARAATATSAQKVDVRSGCGAVMGSAG